MKINVRANLEPFYHHVELIFFQEKGRVIAKPMEFVEHERGMYAQPTTVLELQTAQELMDELWRCGLRPSEGSGSAGALAATQNHLEDLRRLVFKGKQV